MEALAGERIEEPDGVSDQEPARPGPTRHPAAEWGGPGQLVAALRAAPLARIVVGRRDGRHDRVGHRGGALAGEPFPPRPTQDDPDVDPPTGYRGDPDIAAVEHP